MAYFDLPFLNDDCSTCVHKPDTIDYGDAIVGYCSKMPSYGPLVFLFDDTHHFIRSEKKGEVLKCPKHSIAPLQCRGCYSDHRRGGPVITVTLNRAWDNGGYWVRTLCADCGLRGEDGISAEEAIRNWNSGKFESNKESAVLEEIVNLINKRK